MNTHISKELALWLKERGCGIPSKMWHSKYSVLNEGVKWRFIPEEKRVICPKEPDRPAYSWYDILVTHAKEFWGGGTEGSFLENPAYTFYATMTLMRLQKGETQEAEDYVREHSVFAKQDSK